MLGEGDVWGLLHFPIFASPPSLAVCLLWFLILPDLKLGKGGTVTVRKSLTFGCDAMLTRFQYSLDLADSQKLTLSHELFLWFNGELPWLTSHL